VAALPCALYPQESLLGGAEKSSPKPFQRLKRGFRPQSVDNPVDMGIVRGGG